MNRNKSATAALRSGFRSCIRWIYDQLYPPRCPVCLDVVMPKGAGVCAACADKLPLVKEPLCKRCGKPVAVPEAEFCQDCTLHKRSFVQGIALLHYSDEAASRLLTMVKYHNARQLLDYPCQLFGKQLLRQQQIWKAQVLIPVPLHRSKRRKRGYNQAEEIARRLGSQCGLLVDANLLYRVRRTAPQKELNNKQRFANLMQAFAASPEAARYHTVILVDDIFTTGSTAEACARVLITAGVKNVYVAALAIGNGS